ncbi:MAG: hypothetical protein K6A40_11330 [Solobacterium sp.]|nr:hypothetical protein [Solobacterium sp.]
MKKKLFVLFFAAVTAVLTISGCISDTPPEVKENEIMLKIKLDLKEDIGLLIIDHNVSGHEGGGGMSNADKSLIRHDETLYFSFDKEHYEISGNTADLKVRFRVVTEYCDPNYDNIYPEELVVPMDEIAFRADFGKMYSFTITGGRDSGYKAVLEQPQS